MAKNSKKVRLSKNTLPQHYDIFLSPDLDNFTFEGSETIDLKILQPTTQLVLHSAELEVFSAEIIHGKNTETAKKITYNKEEETVTFHFGKKISQGKATLKIIFAGILNNKMRGFYRSRYEHNGKTYHMGVTQFESTDARRAFPCFDEPEHKATFDVSLKVPSDRTVISNTIEKEVAEHDGGYKTVKFATTPKMSSYLLAFIVGHFEFIEATTKEGVVVRVYVTPGKKSQATFALECASKIMSFYHDYFGIDYPLATMDLIAIPDFANGAMENWGAVTYRETALLVDDANTSLVNKQWVALVIAHELAHQWFGNLVTMEWWTHLWLNEGFASFMEYHAVDKLFPEWHIWTQFIFAEQAKALSLDGLLNTHAIEIPVHHPAEINEIFDAVSYSKGASVIRMLEGYVGENDFKKGLQHYLKKHQYSNTKTNDLWVALEKVSKKPVSKIMKNWTGKPGYPLVSVNRVKDGLLFSQERFFSSKLSERKDRTLWSIPFHVAISDEKNPQEVLMSKKIHLLKRAQSPDWIKVNAFDTSFIRVNYDTDELLALKTPILNRDKSFGEEGRFAIIRDAFALVESGHVSTEKALDLVSAYKDETSYIVWAEIVTHLLEIKSLLYGKEIYEDFRMYACYVLKKIGKEVGWSKKKNEKHEDTLLRSAILLALGSFGDKATIEKARERFAKFQKDRILESDLRATVFVLTAENGTKKDFDFFMKFYKDSPSEEEKDRAMRALCSFSDPRLLRIVLDYAFTEEVRAQDAFKTIYFLANNPAGRDIAWSYVKENWETIVRRFEGSNLFARFISPFSRFITTDEAKDVENFFKKHAVLGIERTVAQTIEKIRSNADLLNRDLPKIVSFLKSPSTGI